ncbi:T9SS type B sorting domain-containing protein [Psychroflexus halocasei]|uniref:Gliding motility-associated C-terminal domain-containing protein n=1 Tax=Psychroflexus halocasei TaxID=908615 RepID=A0A1H4C9U5_9FLAO|nr:T9SS type B sorting domain-containing protein [Psychroflexus halocasei]SEA57100.1 gliding motility-associated C-terminal domain-containing protein [Psychroflexus halocasei]
MKFNTYFNIFILFFIFSFSESFAQDFYMEDGETVTTNSGFFYDPGPPDSSIQEGSFVYTICPDGDLYTTIEFIDFFNIGPTHLKIYDGENTLADLLYDFTQQGEVLIPDLNSVYSGTDANSSGCLTFEFDSPFSNDEIQGWKAIIGTRPQCITDAPEIVSFTGGVNVQNDPNYPDDIDYLVYFNEDFTIETSSHFQDNYAQENAHYNWDFGNGTGEGAEVTYRYSELCDFVITLDLEDGYNCQQRENLTLTVRVVLNPNNSPGSVNLDAGDNIRLCEEPGTPMTVDLSATYMDVKEATSYEVINISDEFPSNTPYIFDACYPSDTEVFTELDGDDDWSQAFQLAYEVNFFGNCYDDIIITDNGAVSFDIAGVVPGGRYTPGGYADFSYNEGIPTDAGGINAPYVNSIFGVLQDLHPYSGNNPADQSINYGFIESEDGKSDRFVFNIYNTSQYSCNTQHQTSQIILYQTTNVIEVYIKNKDECSFNNGSSIVGIQNKTGDVAFVPPGRNAGPESPWSTQEEAWRFVPDGGNSITTFKWYDEDGYVVSNSENYNPTVTENTYFTAEVTYDDGCSNVTTITDRIDVLYESDIEIEFAEDTFYPCDGEDLMLEIITTENNSVPVYYTWFKDGVEIAGTNPESRYLNVSESGTYSVIAEGGNCVLEESVEVSYLNEIDADNPEDIILCNYNETTYDLRGIGGFNNLTGFVVKYYGLYDSETGDLSDEITEPEDYSLENADVHEIFVELSNQVNTDCTNIASFVIYEYDVDINPTGYVAEDICIDESSTETIDLTSEGNNTSNALNDQDSSNYTVTYYGKDPLYFPDAIIDDPSNYTIDTNSHLGPNTIWITVHNNDYPDCYAVASFSFNVSLEPTITSNDVVIESCEGSIINLTNYDSSFNNNSTNMAVTVSYYLSEEDFDNNNPINPADEYEFTPDADGSQTLYVAIKNDNSSCISDLKSFEIVNQTPSIENVNDLTQCGDFTLSQTFDLTQNEVEIIGLQSGTYNFTYYLTVNEAETATDSITGLGLDKTAFSPSNAEQDIYFRIEDLTNDSCFNTGSFALIINDVEAIAPSDLEACIDPVSGVAIYDLTLRQDEVLGNDQTLDNYEVNYYDANMDLIGNPTEFETSTEQIITVEVVSQNDLNCSETARLQLVITPQPVASVPPILEVCVNYDLGDSEIDLTQQDESINADGGDEVVYYNSIDAFNNDNRIEDPSAYALPQGQTQIYAAVVNNGSNCRSDMVSFEIDNVLPNVDISNFDGRTVCIDENGNLIVTENSPPVIETGMSEVDYDFVWQLNGTTIPGETSASIVAEQPGTYTVIVTNGLSNIACDNTSSAEILETGQIDFDLEVLTDNFQNNEHSIGVIFTLIGLGDYEVKLDYGEWFDLEEGQTQLIFNNLIGGEHTVIVRDKFGCGMVQKSITLIDFPEFFTPNADGYNDTWNITSIDQADAEINIFDRYGKHIYTTTPTDEGWDGTYKGELLPANDYWFTIKYKEPRTDQVKTFKSHFTLKR